jgi:hypothetical protein
VWVRHRQTPIVLFYSFVLPRLRCRFYPLLFSMCQV